MARLFAALPLDADVRADLSRRLADLRATPAGSAPGVRWTDPDQWHVTLAFYGEVGDDVATRLADRLGRVAARSRPPVLRLGAGGTFGSVRRGQVLTVAVVDETPRPGAAGAAPLARLAERCRAAGRREGLVQPARPYRPHVTLGRGRPGVDLGPLAAALGPLPGDPPATSAASTELLLVRSRLGVGPGGRPEHEPVGRWPLTAGD